MALSVREAEAPASQLLVDWWWRDEDLSWPLLVDPHDLASRLGILVRTNDISPTQSGSIRFFADGATVMSINKRNHPNRHRFTIAHEIAHHLLRDDPSTPDQFTSVGRGTDQIQRNIIGERILGLPNRPEVDRDMPFRQAPASPVRRP